MKIHKSSLKRPRKEPTFEEVMEIIKKHIITNKVPFMTWTELDKELKNRGVKDTRRFFGRVCDDLTWGIIEETGEREPYFEGAILGELKIAKVFLYFPLKMIEMIEV